MNTGSYRSGIDAFIKATEWEVDDHVAKRNMEEVLRWFCRNVPAAQLDKPGDSGNQPLAFRPHHGKWTMLMSWMQAVNFTATVNTHARVSRGDRLTAFRTHAMDRTTHRFGHFYRRADARQRLASPPPSTGLGLPDGQNVPNYYEARHDFSCLETKAGDAFLSWTRTDQSYAHGGAQQLFVWQADRYLDPMRA